jgi:hypothetical protein
MDSIHERIPCQQRSGNAAKVIEFRAAFRPFFAGGHSCQQRSSNAPPGNESRAADLRSM